MYKRKDVYKKAFGLRFYLFIAIIFILLLIFYNFFSDQAWFLWIFSIISSIIGALLVGVYYDFVQKDEISNEHLKIMEYLNEKNSSGIIKYYPTFEDSISDIRRAVIDNNNNELDIYLTYGYTILNNLRNDINYMLSRENTVVNIYLMGKKNPFMDAYSKFWYGDGQRAKLEQKVDQSIQELKDNYDDLTKRKALIGKLNIYINDVSPVNYSFYRFEEELFFVPTKNIETKGFSPITILAQRTSVKDSLYNKVTTELNRMRDEKYFNELELNEEK